MFLALAWPVGAVADPSGQGEVDAVRHFVRETAGSTLRTNGDSDHDATLPTTGVSTGFHRGGNSIDIDAAAVSAYVTRSDGQVERWPEITLGCA